MPQFYMDFDGISHPQKKGLHGKMPQFCPDFDVISKTKQKQVFGLPHTDFLVSFRWAL